MGAGANYQTSINLLDPYARLQMATNPVAPTPTPPVDQPATATQPATLEQAQQQAKQTGKPVAFGPLKQTVNPDGTVGTPGGGFKAGPRPGTIIPLMPNGQPITGMDNQPWVMPANGVTPTSTADPQGSRPVDTTRVNLLGGTQFDGTPTEIGRTDPLRIQLPTDTANLPEGVPADPQERWNLLWKIRQAESSNKNILTATYGHKTASGLVDTGSGYYQMIDPTWKKALQYANLPDRWDHAIDAPGSVQDQAAYALLMHEGTTPWNASKHNWSKDDAPFVKGYSGTPGDTTTSLGHAPTPPPAQTPPGATPATPGAVAGNQLALPQQMDMRKMMAMSMLRSMLGSGMGFQRVTYDPWKVRQAGEQSGIMVGGGPGWRTFQGQRVESAPARAAYEPGSLPRLGRKGADF